MLSPTLHPLLAPVSALLLGLLPAATLLHPQDGPDADVRVRVDDDSVRFNIVMNLAFTDEIVDAPREERDFLHPLEYDALRDALFHFYRDTNRITVDGVQVTPVDQGFEVEEADLDLLPLFPLAGARALMKVRLTLDYPLKAPPDRVKIYWGTYPPNRVMETADGAPPLEITAHVSSGGAPQTIVFTTDQPDWTWRRDDAPAVAFLDVPTPERARFRVPALASSLGLLALVALVSVGFVRGASRRRALVAAALLGVGSVVSANVLRVEAKIADEQALAVFRPLHANIYRAFDYADESDVYDALARSVDGNLLDDLYNQIYRGLVMQDHGGAVCRIESVDVLDAEVGEAQDGTFDVTALWQVKGAVYHWGHSHTRTNEYRARYVVHPSGDGWRIGASQVLEQRRVEAAPLQDGEFEEF